ncbi:coenzyme F420-0:L-glutamate ligase/coenzyme F420-1:gamma-L-glutamate ligase [Antricoccus suffuscus]|uniref:Coenzyme F420-0:L-glutamate ligase/coenzyme F420-1:gamma-L-glutamate ligase n=1 Tax=Antricoccus suffuscus TaxID=1629062 RepID=A0A2T0ZQH2_9ACTN|nr:coenzyme F420-0:L-glutamate ligase [Antricoccus suffuscus]PRZ38602.1 coenzyme F420-0:L-glutamate ligase/coenzyme F420-1:gamma-L-glutamate ligase [Antricoccus suffuscus]
MTSSDPATPAGAEDLPKSFSVHAVTGLPEFHHGDDLVGHLPALEDRDIVVVTSKVISKIEGRLVAVGDGEEERQRAREDAITGQTVAVVAQRGPTRIVRNQLGLTMAAAGIDASNVPNGVIALLPEDPDASARRLRAAIRRRLSRDVAVIITDTVGRPWREGLVDIAIGVAGITPLRDLRGTLDTHGHPLAVTALAQADEIASASELVRGKVGSVPVAVVRGIPWQDGEVAASSLIRGGETDMFSLGTRDVVPATASGAGAGIAAPQQIEAALAAVPEVDGVSTSYAAATIAVHSRIDSFETGVYVGKLLVALRAEGLIGSVASRDPVQIETTVAAAYQGRPVP